MRSLAGIIQGEASGTAAQFAVASTIFNRARLGTFPGGSDPVAVANAPLQFTGFNPNPSTSARVFADAIMNGTLPNFGNTGNAVNFGSNLPGNSFASNHGLTQGTNIGGNFFSDRLGPPTSNFVPPQYGAVDPAQQASGGFLSPFTNPFSDTVGNGGSGNFAPDSTGSFTGVPNQDFSNPNPGVPFGGGNTFQPSSPVFSPNTGEQIGNEAPIPGNTNNQTFLNTFGGTTDFSGLAPPGVVPSLAGVDGIFSPANTGNAGDLVNPLFDSAGNIVGAANNLFSSGSSDTTKADSTWWNTFLNDLGDYSLRGGLILLAIVLIGAAAWAFSSGSVQRFARNVVSKK